MRIPAIAGTPVEARGELETIGQLMTPTGIRTRLQVTSIAGRDEDSKCAVFTAFSANTHELIDRELHAAPLQFQITATPHKLDRAFGVVTDFTPGGLREIFPAMPPTRGQTANWLTFVTGFHKQRLRLL